MPPKELIEFRLMKLREALVPALEHAHCIRGAIAELEAILADLAEAPESTGDAQARQLEAAESIQE